MSPTKSTDKSTETEPARTAYKLTQGTHTVWEGSKTDGRRVTYDARTDNNVVELTDEEAAHPAFRGRIERVQGQPGQYEATVATRTAAPTPNVDYDGTPLDEGKTGAPEGGGTATNDANANNWTNKLSGLSWQEAVEQVDVVEDASELDAMRTAEESGKNRKSVLEAIDARREELAGA